MGSLVAELAEKLSSATNNFDIDEGTIYVNTSADTVAIGGTSPDGKFSIHQSASADILNLYDGTTAVFTVLDGGNVGIGTTSPAKQLSVYRTSSVTDNGAVLLDGNGNYAGLQFAASGTLYGSIAPDTTALVLSHTSGLLFKTGAGTNVGGSERMKITSDGKVGIGTSAPDEVLHLVSSTSLEPVLKIENTNDNNLNAQIHLVKNPATGGAEADDDYLGQIDFKGLNDVDASPITFGRIQSQAKDVSDGTEDGRVFIASMNAGTLEETFNVVSGKVGIGTSAPATNLEVAHSGHSNSGAVRIGDPSTIGNNTSIYMRTTGVATIGTGGGDIVFDTNIGSAERMRIVHSTGRVGIGITSPGFQLDLQNGGGDGIRVAGYSTGAGNDARLYLARSNNGTQGTQTAVDNSDFLGKVIFQGSNGSAFTSGASISAVARETWSGTQYGTELGFSVTKTGETSLTETLVLDKNAHIKMQSEAVLVNGGNNPTITVDGAVDAFIVIDKAATYRSAELQFKTNGSLNWVLGTPDSDSFGNGDEFFIGRASGAGSNVDFVIETDGKVGIGTSAPDQQLEVRNSSSAYTCVLQIGANGVSGENREFGAIHFKNNHSNASGVVGAIEAFRQDADTQVALRFNTHTSGSEITRLIIGATGNVTPGENNVGNLGASDLRWATVFSVNVLNTSDRNEKKEIKENKLGLDFINALKTKSYKFKDNTLGGSTHYGLIAQDIENVLNKFNIKLDEYAPVVKDKIKDENENERFIYSLAYNELLAPIIKSVQELSAKNDALSEEISSLKNTG